MPSWAWGQASVWLSGAVAAVRCLSCCRTRLRHQLSFVCRRSGRSLMGFLVLITSRGLLQLLQMTSLGRGARLGVLDAVLC